MDKYIMVVDYSKVAKTYDRLFEITTDNEELFEELCDTLESCLQELNSDYLWDYVEDLVGSENFFSDSSDDIIEFFKLSGMQDCKYIKSSNFKNYELDALIEYNSSYEGHIEEHLDDFENE